MNPRVPEGIRTSGRPLGTLAVRWLEVFEGFDARLRPRVVRGKTLARGGRVRELEVAPGAALGEVKDTQTHRPTLRVRTFDEREWGTILEVLRSRLDLLGSLVDGTLEPELLTLFEERGVPLLPRPDEIDGDCDCGDWAVPCPHVAAVHHVVGEGLEGEPFLVFTMRGRPRDQLLSDLRRSWGDVGGPTTQAAAGPPDEPLRDVDVFAAPERLPPMRFRFDTRLSQQPGMVELGPLAGDDDLLRALAPLYDAAGSFATDVALGGGDAAAEARPSRRRVVTGAPQAESKPLVPPSGPQEIDLAEEIVDVLEARAAPASAGDLAAALHVDVRRATKELEALEKVGLVFSPSAGLWQLG